MKNISKIILAFVLSISAVGASVADDDILIQMTTNEIATLKRQISTETAKLEDCAKKTKGFQIAGGITLGLTAVGVGVNIYQAVKRDQVRKEILATDEKLAEAQRKLETVRAVALITDMTKLDADSELSPGDKVQLMEIVRELGERLASLEEAAAADCSSDCENMKSAIRTVLGIWKPKLGIS